LKVKFLKWISSLLAFGFVAFVIQYGIGWNRNNQVGLTDSVRSDFIESSMSACIRGQTTAPENIGILVAILTQYCTCYSNGMADRLSNNELKSISDQKPEQAIAMMQPKIDAAAKPCTEAVFKK
jgi:hypothetical protein